MLGFFSPTPSHCEECCYKHSSTIFCLNSCFLFFGVYAQERNCWVTWYISVYNLPWDHQVSSTVAVPFTISLPATYENPYFSTSMPKSVCFFLFLNNFLFIYLLAALHRSWSSVKDWNCTPCSGSMEFQPLDCQANPPNLLLSVLLYL